jgi:hypothetical protein
MFLLMEPSSGDTLTNFMLLNCASYIDPYIVLIIVCYNKLKNMVFFFPPHYSPLYAQIKWLCFYTALKMYLKIY